MMLMVVAFAVFWTTKARAMGASFIFTLFGIGFAIMAISGFVSVVVSMINGGAPGSTASNDTEPAELYRPNTEEDSDWQESQYRECTYCGTRVDRGVHRCPNCGAGI
jgi:DNA-directed RNA polymerase subunit RPC12/RpoP